MTSLVRQKLLPLLGLAVLTVAPLWGGHYLHFLLATIVVYTLVAMSLTILIGMGGQISIGHAGFWALGAYGSALLVLKLGLPFLISVLLGGLLAALFGALLALPAFRIQGHYLAIATLGFALFIQQMLFEWESLTGGRQGIFVPRAEVFGIRLTDDFEYYYLLLAIMVLTWWLIANFKRSHTGRALVALKMSPIAAQCAGVNRRYHLFVAFTLSAFLTGISGALYSPLINHLSTESFSLIASLSFLTMAVIGGVGSPFGAFLGATYLTLYPELTRDVFHPSAQMVVYGLTLVLCMRFLPSGLASVPSEVRALLARRRGRQCHGAA